MPSKEILLIKSPPAQHWVGDGFLVSSVFSYNQEEQLISPFLLLDYGAPYQFTASNIPKGVGEHPHRGFETVTIVYQGEIEHRDNHGNYGKIGQGDVQWMTAGHGVIHSEKHSLEFTKNGGIFEVAQLWVNLPAKHKLTPAKYQDIKQQDIPIVNLNDNAGYLRIIAGQYQGINGIAQTFSPVNLFDGYLKQNHNLNLTLIPDFTLLILLMHGEMVINENKIHAGELVIFKLGGDNIILEAQKDSKFLIMHGDPLNEPIAGYGPFVMNTREEIEQAFKDYQNNKF